MSVERSTIGVDLDGVCADFVHGLREIVAWSRGIKPDELTTAVDWEFKAWDLRPGDYMRYYELAIRQFDIWKNLPVYPDAVRSLNRLRASHGADIRIVTSRPDPFKESDLRHIAIRHTSEWLQKNGIFFNSFNILSEKEDLDCTVYIEDAPKQIRRFQSASIPVVVMNRSWNSHVEDLGMRAWTWDEAVELVSNCLG